MEPLSCTPEVQVLIFRKMERREKIHRENTIWGKERILDDIQSTDVISLLYTFSSDLGGIDLAKGFPHLLLSYTSSLCEGLKCSGLYFSWMLSSISHRLRLWQW